MINRYNRLYFESDDPWLHLRSKYRNQGIDVDIYNSNHNISSLSLLKIPKELRGQGIAKTIMKEICKEADRLNITLSLTPTNEFGASKSKLIDFYKSFGFVNNNGKHKDFRIRDTMLRLPR